MNPMKRTILTPPVLPAGSLGELKAWLAITSAAEDEMLTRLLRASLDMCEAFTGRVPLACLCEEIHPVRPGWQALLAEPVQSIEGVEGIPGEGARFAMGSGDYAASLGADGTGRFRIIRQGAAGRVAVRFTAGLADEWESLPGGLRQGILHYAAHLYRMRDSGEVQASPPAAIAALWRGWRRMRVA